jgi:hypothetical protein
MRKRNINNCIQRKNRIRLIGVLFTITLFAFLPYNLSAQWSFTATLTYSGKCYAEYLPSNFSIPFNGIPTKVDCESFRSMVLSIQVGGECRVFYRCTSCTGSDMVNSQQMMPGSISFRGTETGKAFFSPSPGQTTQDWINSVQEKAQSLGFNHTNSSNNGFTLPRTGDNSFDDAYSNLVDNTFKKDANRIIYSKGQAPFRGKRLAEPGYGIQTDYKSNGYKVLKEMGEKVGLDLSNYLTEEEWYRDTRTMTLSEINEHNRKFGEFMQDLHKRQKGEPLDPKGEEESLLTEEDINKIIDMVADIAAYATPAYTVQGLAITAGIYSAAEVAKLINATYHGSSYGGAGTMATNVLKNTTKSLLWGAGGKMAGSAEYIVVSVQGGMIEAGQSKQFIIWATRK